MSARHSINKSVTSSEKKYSQLLSAREEAKRKAKRNEPENGVYTHTIGSIEALDS